MNVIIPTRNDYYYLENIVRELLEINEINKIIIVNNNSYNKITKIIKRISLISPKCLYLECEKIGKGEAIRRGLEEISKDPKDVIFIDADIANFNKNIILLLRDALNNRSDLVKANFIRKNGQSISSFVLPILKIKYPELNISRPTGGIYGAKKKVINMIRIPNSWEVDLSILIQAFKQGFSISEVFIGEIEDKKRSNASLEYSRKCLLNELKILEAQ